MLYNNWLITVSSGLLNYWAFSNKHSFDATTTIDKNVKCVGLKKKKIITNNVFVVCIIVFLDL